MIACLPACLPACLSVGSGVQAESGGVVWGMERSTFRSIIVVSSMQKRQRYEECLAGMPLFSALTPHQRAAIADCLSLDTFQVICCCLLHQMTTGLLCCIAYLLHLFALKLSNLQSHASTIAESLLLTKVLSRLLASL